jgi:hypothetical protein
LLRLWSMSAQLAMPRPRRKPKRTTTHEHAGKLTGASRWRRGEGGAD